MAKASSISSTVRCCACAVTFLPRTTHRFLRLLGTRCRRGVRLTTTTLTRASKSNKRGRTHRRPQSPPPRREVETPKKPKRLEAEQEAAVAPRREEQGGDDTSPAAAGAVETPKKTKRSEAEAPQPRCEEQGGDDTSPAAAGGVEIPKKPKRPEAEAAQPRCEEQGGRGDGAATAAEDEVAVAGKYWAQRYSLFSLYDRGVRMDAEGWYSATPETIAAAQAARAPPAGIVVDAFAGVGGNSIQFAARGCYVVAVEIDSRKVELAAHNARIYGVEDKIEFIVGDFFHLAPSFKADLVFLSPPWGGPSYKHAQVYSLDMLKPKDGYAVFQAALEITPNIIMFLPRNVNMSQVEELSWLCSPPLDFVSEENYIQHRFKGITAYFGGMAREVQKPDRDCRQISSKGFSVFSLNSSTIR